MLYTLEYEAHTKQYYLMTINMLFTVDTVDYYPYLIYQQGEPPTHIVM